jgi:hypothetical protein
LEAIAAKHSVDAIQKTAIHVLGIHHT